MRLRRRSVARRPHTATIASRTDAPWQRLLGRVCKPALSPESSVVVLKIAEDSCILRPPILRPPVEVQFDRREEGERKSTPRRRGGHAGGPRRIATEQRARARRTTTSCWVDGLGRLP